MLIDNLDSIGLIGLMHMHPLVPNPSFAHHSVSYLVVGLSCPVIAYSSLSASYILTLPPSVLAIHLFNFILSRTYGARILDWCSTLLQPTSSPSIQKKKLRIFFGIFKNLLLHPPALASGRRHVHLLIEGAGVEPRECTCSARVVECTSLSYCRPMW
jgi:hypothetical protein